MTGSDTVVRLAYFDPRDAAWGLDLSGGALVVDGPWAESAMIAYIAQGYNGGLWDGGGIYSSEAAASGGLTGVGYASAAQLGVTSWDGEAISSDGYVFKYTYAGDMNLDGVVDQQDLSLYAVAGGSNGGAASWATGDFNYDGVRNAADYAMLQYAYANQGDPL